MSAIITAMFNSRQSGIGSVYAVFAVMCVFVLVFLVVPVKTCEAVENEQAYALFTQAQKLSDEKKYDEALECLNKAIAIEPKFARAYGECGNVYSSTGDYNKAIMNFNTALELDPSLALKVYANRGSAYSKMEQYQNAINDFSAAIKLAGGEERSMLYIMRGLAYCDNGQYEDALKDVETVKALNDPTMNTFIYTVLGKVYTKQHKWDDALVQYGKMAEQPEPGERVMGYFLCGSVYYEQGNYESAINMFTKALDIAPNASDLYNIRGACYEKLGNKEKAEMDFQSAKQADTKI